MSGRARDALLGHGQRTPGIARAQQRRQYIATHGHIRRIERQRLFVLAQGGIDFAQRQQRLPQSVMRAGILRREPRGALERIAGFRIAPCTRQQIALAQRQRRDGPGCAASRRHKRTKLLACDLVR